MLRYAWIVSYWQKKSQNCLLTQAAKIREPDQSWTNEQSQDVHRQHKAFLYSVFFIGMKKKIGEDENQEI